MTREEAITIISNWLACSQQNHEHCEKYDKCEGCPYVVYQPFDIALEMAISALNSLEEVYAKGYDDGFTQAEVNYENDKALSQDCTDAVSGQAVLGSLCNSCTNIGCEFQSGIVRTKCAFYMPPHIESDNCGNYVVMQPTAEANNALNMCDDAISREAVMKIVDEEWICNADYDFRSLVESIEKLPPVTQKSDNKYRKYRKEAKRWKNKWLKSQKSGKWIKKKDDTCWWYVCSECEQEPLKNRWNDDDVLSTFCPNCGAKMESEEQTE